MKDLKQTVKYSNHPSSNFQTTFHVSNRIAKECPFHTKYLSCNSYVQNNSKRHTEAESRGMLRHWNIVQNKLCYNSRPFRKMSEDVLTSYCELLNVFELNWTIVEPLCVPPCADFIPSTKIMHPRKSTYLNSLPLCFVNMSQEVFLSQESAMSSEDAFSLTCSCAKSYASSEQSLEDILDDNTTHTSYTFESKVVSNVLNRSQEDTSLGYLNSTFNMQKIFCHYILFPFELTSQQCIIEFPGSYSESSLKVLNSNVISDDDQRNYFNCDSTKSDATLNLFESKIKKADVSLLLQPQTPLFRVGSKSIISSKESCTVGTNVPGRSTDLDEYKAGIQIMASKNLSSPEISYYVSKQLDKLELTGCCYPSNMLVIFLQIPFNVKYYLQQNVYQRSFGPSPFYLKDVKPIPKCNRFFLQNKKVTWHNNVFARVFQWKSNKKPMLIRSRSLNSRDLQKKSISLFVFCSGKDMIAFDWLPFLSRLYSFSVREYKYKMSSIEQFNDTVTLKVPSYLNRQQPSKASVQIHSFIDNSHCSLRFASLILEYPGSGQSSGSASIETVMESTVNGLAKALEELSNRLCVSHIDIRFIGYSLGSAVALRLAHILSLDIAQCNELTTTVLKSPLFNNLKNPPDITMSRVILVAPFTSVADWATMYLKIPSVFQPIAKKLIDPLLNMAGISWNNSEYIKHLSLIIKQYIHMFPSFKIHIFHGNKDSMVPFYMGEELASLSKRIFETDSTSKYGSFNDATSLFSQCEYKTAPSTSPRHCMPVCEPVTQIQVSPNPSEAPNSFATIRISKCFGFIDK
ncbi:uncharacterized protein LOC128883279 isoform X2 [Hylaeus volcanicus]|uniref:uncharacterized protein LOC128883279 isoform X2 n=1 Tax=Hylaeus volcanicus TaxID=313075 RepID=UPI0023B85AD8|nr:uncharacterized protein LOC128883279 isoform X2 [Hylaeus volcanicus]